MNKLAKIENEVIHMREVSTFFNTITVNRKVQTIMPAFAHVDNI